MGSKNCPETPRQKMIGMMYLFLTAMLAINVSPEILKSFLMVDESLRNSVENFGDQNKIIYNEFSQQNQLNATKVQAWYDKAMSVKAESEMMITYIQGLKESMARRADKDKYRGADSLKNLDNLEIPSQFLLSPIGVKHGEKLRDSIGDYKNVLLSLVDDKGVQNVIASNLATPDPKEEPGAKDEKLGKKKWEDEMFGEKPTVAAIAMLTKIQNDIRNSEAVTINYLFGQIDAKDIKVNQIDGFINPKSTYILKGGTFKAQIGIMAVDSTKTPDIFIDGVGQVKTDDDGMYEIPANSVGSNEISGYVRIEDAEGVEQKYPFGPIQYEVAEPVAVVSATKMNVLYAGVDNPVSISVPGVSANQINATISNGRLVKSGSGYIAKPSSLGMAVIKVVATIEGKQVQIGSGMEFRVKSLPPPTAYLSYPVRTKNADGKYVDVPTRFTGGRIRKRDLISVTEIGAELEDADFEVSYKVLGFQMTTYDSFGNARNMQTTSNKFDSKQMAELRSLTGGKTFFISRIRVMGPDGLEKTLPAMEVSVY